MAQPARQRRPSVEEPPVDPLAIERAYRAHRARRRAKVERTRERARAKLRFLIATFVLIACAITLILVLWHEVQSVFGL